jgi:hypothetical protein
MALTISRPRTLGNLTVTVKDEVQTFVLRDLSDDQVIEAVRHYFGMNYGRHEDACPICRRIDKRITTRPTRALKEG